MMPGTIHEGDAIEVMRTFDVGEFDAIITDPPYCSGGLTEAGKGRATHMGLRSETMRMGRFAWFSGDNMTTTGLAYLLRSVAVEGLRIVKPSGHLLVFCDWRMVAILSSAIESAGWRHRNIIVWDKGHFGAGTGFRPQHEMILHFANRAPEFHSADVGNVIKAARVHTTKRVHATEKPIELMRKLVRIAVPEGGALLDCFAGSGTTLEAGVEERSARVVGIERDPEMLAFLRRNFGEVGTQNGDGDA